MSPRAEGMSPLRRLYRWCLHTAVDLLDAAGARLMLSADYYSPLPSRRELRRTRARWDRPSALVGLRYDLDAMRALSSQLSADHAAEYAELPPYEQAKHLGCGPGFTIHDAWWLFAMLRHLKPRRFVEIGSGLSTYYASAAARRNAQDGRPMAIMAIDPYVREQVRSLPDLEVLATPVQDVAMATFERLDAGDVLFIDSTHVVRIDGDVPHLYLEVLPRLASGVVIHSHDIHFPYNVPHPAEQYIFRSKWPRYWTEAMLLQAFLAFNSDFEMLFAPALLRHLDEDHLRATVPGYRPLEVGNHDTHFGSLWYGRK